MLLYAPNIHAITYTIAHIRQYAYTHSRIPLHTQAILLRTVHAIMINRSY